MMTSAKWLFHPHIKAMMDSEPVAQSDEARLERRVALALMAVFAAPPASDGQELPVLAFDPDFDDLPEDHTQGTEDDEITQEAVLRLARAAIKAVRE